MDVQSRSEEATVARYNTGQERIIRDFGYGDTTGAMAIVNEYLKELSSVLKTNIENSKFWRDSNSLKSFAYLIRQLDPDLVSLAVLNGCLQSIAQGEKLVRTVSHVGKTIEGECWAHGLLLHDTQLAARIATVVKKRHGNIKYRRQAARSIAARLDYRGTRWGTEAVVKAGRWLVWCVVRAMPDVFSIVLEDDEEFLTISPDALAIAEAAVERAIQAHPVLLPCTDPPKPWTDWDKGGYWDERSRLRTTAIRAYHKETAAAVRGAMKAGTLAPHIDALNSLQSVPFTINERILDVVRACYGRGILVDGLPSKVDVELPPKPGVWEKLNDDQKKVWKHTSSKIKEHNRSLIGDRVLLAQDTATASELSTGTFYTPLNCDWRGRTYAVSHFNFQRDDRVRALFQFANGLPLGADGLYWLKVHTANCGDFDKISKQPLAAREAWVDANIERIKQCAEDPLNTAALSFWTTGDKPFLFLAACMELAQALSCTTPSDFVTTLPLAFDGSCSGLQHLCAMTRAPEGSLVNLTQSATPQDVYQTVATVVQSSVHSDAAAGNELAKLCLAFGITRKVVKRNVMTYAYSSKKYGMAKQQEEDLISPLSFDVLSGKLKQHPFGVYAEKPHPRAASPAAKYLAEKVYDAIKSVVNLPQQAMVFLQQSARALAHEGKPLTWTTPTGLPWANRYHTPTLKRVELWLHDTRVQMMIADGVGKEIDKDKAANGVAPNFVHALDASHLMLTVNAAVREGITSLATVHDSFGCLAPQARRFNEIIREQFVKMYSDNDVLSQVHTQASADLTIHNRKRLPEGIQYGSLPLDGVLQAEYAFA